MGPLTYFRADERPYWQATVRVNGQLDDMSSGYTFRVTLTNAAGVATAKTSGMTGASGGVVTVAWSSTDLDITPGVYAAQLKATRTADQAEWTIQDTLQILTRN